MAKCPKCGSPRFEYQLRSGGADLNSKYYRKLNRRSTSWIIPAGQKKVRFNRKDVSVGFCPDCGYMQEYKQPMPAGIRTALIVIAILGLISSIFGGTDRTAKDGSIWAHEITPIEQFEYIIDGDKIHLGDYIGKASRVYIGLEYEIDGEMMPVVEIGCHLRGVTSCIIPDGAKEIKNSMFNGSSVKYLYLPATLEEFKGWSYFHDLEYLYYGGSEEEFKIIHGGDASHLVSKRIYYNASIDDIIEQDIKAHPTAEPTASN